MIRSNSSVAVVLLYQLLKVVFVGYRARGIPRLACIVTRCYSGSSYEYLLRLCVTSVQCQGFPSFSSSLSTLNAAPPRRCYLSSARPIDLLPPCCPGSHSMPLGPQPVLLQGQLDLTSHFFDVIYRIPEGYLGVFHNNISLAVLGYSSPVGGSIGVNFARLRG